jgi:pyrroline-5-carboxylate reductase
VLAEIKPAACLKQSLCRLRRLYQRAELIKTGIGFDAKVIRVLPNTPLLIACGSTALSCIEPTTKKNLNLIKRIFPQQGGGRDFSGSDERR